MVVIAWKHPARLTQGEVYTDLCLQIVGSSRNGQVLRLKASKCTIGSAEGCTVRLRARGVAPVHCVILRGTRGAVVRAWAGTTLHNGQRVIDAWLTPGDRLTVGPIEFLVLHNDASAHFNAERAVVAEPTRGRDDRPSRDANSTLPSAHASRPARQRARRLIDSLRQLRLEVEQLRQQTADAQQREQQIADRDLELTARLQNFAIQQQAWESQCAESQSNLDARTAQLDIYATQLAALESTLADQSSQLEASRQAEVRWHEESQQAQQATQLLGEQHAQLERERESLRLARDSFEQQRAAWSMTNAQARAELDRERGELLAEREEHARIVRELQLHRAQIQSQFDSKLAGLEQEQAAWKSHRSAEETRLRQESDRLESALAEMREKQQLLDTQQYQSLVGQDQMTAELAAARDAFAEERRLFENQCIQLRELDEQRAAELNAKAECLRQATEQLQARESQFLAEQAAWNAAIAESKEQQADMVAANVVTRRNLEADLRVLQNERQGLVDAMASLGELESRLDLRQEELVARETQVLEAQLACRELQQQLVVSQTELAAQQQELTDRQWQFTAEVAKWQMTRVEEDQAAQQQKDEQIAQLLEQLVQQQRDCETHRAELRQASEALSAALAQVEQERGVIEQQRAELDRHHACANQLADESRQIAAARAAIANERAALESERSAWELQQRATEQRLEQKTAELAERAQHLMSQAEAMAQSREQQNTVTDSDHELVARSAELAERISRFEIERQQAAAEHEQRLARVEQRERELDDRDAAQGESSLRESSTHSVMGAAELDEQARLIAQEREQLEAARERLAEDRRAFDEERLKNAMRLDAEHEELKQLRAALEAQAAAAPRSSLASELIDAVDADEAEDEVPVGVRSWNAVSQQSSETRSTARRREEDEVAAEDELEETPGARPALAPQATQPRPKDGEEESIEEYMAALLTRMRGGATPEPAPEPEPKRRRRKADPTPQAVEASGQAESSSLPVSPVVDLPQSPAEMVRRSKPVKDTSDMAAMRDLANTQARMAIDTHGKRQLFKSAMGNYVAGGACVVATLASLIFVHPRVAHIGAMAGLVSAVYFFYRGGRASRKLSFRKVKPTANSQTGGAEREAK